MWRECYVLGSVIQLVENLAFPNSRDRFAAHVETVVSTRRALLTRFLSFKIGDYNHVGLGKLLFYH
jgi:hypothetical protein